MPINFHEFSILKAYFYDISNWIRALNHEMLICPFYVFRLSLFFFIRPIMLTGAMDTVFVSTHRPSGKRATGLSPPLHLPVSPIINQNLISR